MGKEIFDVVIIGSGPAGYTAALYAARENLKTLLFQGLEAGGQLMLTSYVENYPGFEEGIVGPEMMDAFEVQAARFGAEMCPENVWRVDFSEPPFRLWPGAEEEPVMARSVVIATGGKAKWLGVAGERRLMGRGVSGCAICDAFLFRGKRVAVVGGGDTAMEEAGVLAGYADEVILIHRREEFRASKAMLRRVRRNPKIRFLTGSVVEEILGEYSVEGIRVRMGRGERTLRVDGVFVAAGHRPASDLFRDQVETDEDGYIALHGNTSTSVPGVFAAGEVADRNYRQAATAVGTGCMAAMDAQRWLEGGPSRP